MPFFSRQVSLSISEEGTTILEKPAGVEIKSLHIGVVGATAGARVFVSSHPDALTTGLPIAWSITFDGVGEISSGVQTLHFTAEELKCLTREDVKLYASAEGNAATVCIFGVIAY